MQILNFVRETLSSVGDDQVVYWVAQAVIVIAAQLGWVVTKKAAIGAAKVCVQAGRGTMNLVRGEPIPEPTRSEALNVCLETLASDDVIIDKGSLHYGTLIVQFTPNDCVSSATAGGGADVEKVLSRGEWLIFCEAASSRKEEIIQQKRHNDNVALATKMRGKAPAQLTKEAGDGRPVKGDK